MRYTFQLKIEPLQKGMSVSFLLSIIYYGNTSQLVAQQNIKTHL